MSMSYWICEGVGIRANQRRPFLNTQKCVQLFEGTAARQRNLGGWV